MLALEAVIVTRLREVLPAGWVVKGLSSDAGKREAPLFASVSFADADVPDAKAGAANVRAAWRVLLVGKRGDTAAAAIDEAFAVCMAGLHNWAPGEVAGRHWERLRLGQVQPPQYADDGLVGLELSFNTSARYDGQA